MKRLKTCKTLTAVCMAFCLVMSVLSMAEPHLQTVEAKSPKFKTCKVKRMDFIGDISDIPATFTQKDLFVERNDKVWHESRFKFKIPTDSWVCFGGRYANTMEEGLQTHVRIYSDRKCTRLVGEYGWGYWEYDKSFKGVLKQGIYYGKAASRYANFGDFEGDVVVLAARMPEGRARELGLLE